MKSSAQLLSFIGKWIFNKNLFFSILFFTLLLFLSTSFLAKPTNAYSGYNTAPNVELNHHNAIQILVVDILSAASCQIAGIDPSTENGKCIGIDPITAELGYFEKNVGAIGLMGLLIDATIKPPITSTQYISYLKENFGFAKNAYAAECTAAERNENGIGFCGLLPLLEIWEVMRNIVYLLLILIFVIVGIGIMLRLHIDPRTVMTIQNQIPKIIVGILAITFSFAIAGFLIDMMWFSVYLFASIISLVSKGSFTSDQILKVTQASDPFFAVDNIFGEGFGIWDVSTLVASTFSSLIVSTVSGALGDALSTILGGLITILGTLIIFIAILVLLIRLWVSLIMAYIYVILDVIFAPFWILAGLLPGSSMGLGSWLRDLIANLAVFPMTIAFILLGGYLMTVMSGPSSDNVLVPPLVGGTNPTGIAALIGFGFLLMLPNMLSTMKAALKTPKMSFGNLMGPVGSGAGFVTSVPKSVIQTKTAAKEIRMEKIVDGNVKYGNTGTPRAIINQVLRR